MDNKITTYVIDKTFQEVYGVDNDKCPICGKPFITLTNIAKLGNIAYHLECYTTATNQGVNLK